MNSIMNSRSYDYNTLIKKFVMCGGSQDQYAEINKQKTWYNSILNSRKLASGQTYSIVRNVGRWPGQMPG